MGKLAFKGITIGLGSIKWIIHQESLVEFKAKIPITSFHSNPRSTQETDQ